MIIQTIMGVTTVLLVAASPVLLIWGILKYINYFVLRYRYRKPTATNATHQKVLSNRLQRYKERGPEYIKKNKRWGYIFMSIGFIGLLLVPRIPDTFFEENFAWYAESAIRVGAFGFSIFLFYLLYLILLASLALLLFGLGSVIYWKRVDLKIRIADNKITGEQLLEVGRNSGLHFIISGLISAALATIMIFILINY